MHCLGYLFFLAEGILVCYCTDVIPDSDLLLCTKTATWTLVILSSSVTGFIASGYKQEI